LRLPQSPSPALYRQNQGEHISEHFAHAVINQITGIWCEWIRDMAQGKLSSSCKSSQRAAVAVDSVVKTWPEVQQASFLLVLSAIVLQYHLLLQDSKSLWSVVETWCFCFDTIL